MNNLTNSQAALLLGLLMLGHAASAAPMQAIQQADAQTSAPNYVGASIGTAHSDAFCAELDSCSDADSTWKVYSGIRLTEKIQLEGAYIRFGEQQGSTATTSDTTTNTITSTSATSGYTAAALVTYPLSDGIELFGKGGMLWWDQELKTGTETLSRSGSNYFLGAGANYDLGDNLGVRAEWERYEGVQAGTDNSLTESMDLISVGVTFSSL